MTLTRPIDAVIVFPSQTFGGAEYWLLDLIAAIETPVRWEAVLLAEGPLRQTLEESGIAVTVFATGTHPRELASTMLRLSAWLKDRRPDVVLANGVKSAAVAAPACIAAGVRMVWVRHDFTWDDVLGRALVLLSDHIVGTSPELLDAIGAEGTVIFPPLPPAPATKDEAIAFWRERGVTLRRPTLAMTCRLIAYKGIDDAIRALAHLGVEWWNLVVIGSDDPTTPGEQATLEALATELGVADRVQFTGSVPQASRWLAAFDAVAVLTKPHPVSRYQAEGFSMVVLESVMAGVPVVVSDTTPAARLVPNAVLSVKPGSPVDVARALLDIRRLTPEAVATAALLAATHPTVEQSAAELLRVITETATRPGAGALTGPPMSIVITVLNDAPSLRGLFDALVPQLGVDDEVVVIDGGSTDDSANVVERWTKTDPRIRGAVVPGAGISAGRNRAIQLARHDIIATTDAGCVPDRGWVDALRAAMSGPAAPAIATGVYSVSTRSAFDRASALACYPDATESSHPSLVVRAFSRLGRVFAADEPTGRSMAFRREAWVAAGGFNESLPTAEDVAFGAAIVESGGRAVLTTDATVHWEQRPTVRATVQMYRRYGLDGGRSRRLKPIVRDLARAGAYGLAAVAIVKGGRSGRATVGVGVAAYLAQPLGRGVAQRAELRALALVPVALVVKDVSKALGCLQGLVASRADGVG